MLALFSLAGVALADHEPGHKVLVLKNKDGAALLGYDAVAYFTDHKPMKANARFQSEYEGAKYFFVSADHKKLFDADPAKYAPAYGGYCGYAASIGKVRPANPLLWSIVDGRLIVQHTRGAAELWEKDVPGNKAKADGFWPRLVEVKAGKKNPVDSLLGKSVLADAP
jgi:YHS domain-containing protein